jgi:molybdate transport system substrate-binding protein
MRWMRFCAAWLAALLLVAGPARAAPAPRAITVLAAASLSDVLREVGRTYESKSGGRVNFSFAGSMILARQIEASAGADMFIAADSDSMDYVQQRNLIRPDTRTDLFGNSLVLIAPADSRLALALSPGVNLAAALQGGRLALANVEAVPAGRYGRAALTALGVWDSVRTRLAEGEDVRAALAYVSRGEAPLGIVYATDAKAEKRVRVVAGFPAASHPPIVYPVALTREARAEAGSFLAFLKGPDARAAFARAGFLLK